jgi:hypothetical protein
MKQSIVAIAFASCLAAFAAPASADSIPQGSAAFNMKAIGYTGVGGRGGAFKMVVRRVGDKWYMYAGHLWDSGWSILDVTDAANPKFLKFVPGPDNTNTIQMEIHGNTMITALQRRPPNWGGDPKRPNDEGAIIWDISDPVNWKKLSQWKTGANGIHRIGYPGGNYFNAAATMPGFRGQILVFVDISDPTNPKEAGRWWLHGQKDGETPARTDISFHGPAIISEDGKKAYVGYGPEAAILDISDIAHPKPIGELTLSPPFGGIPVHDVFPIPGRQLLYAHAEATGGGDSPDGPLACTGALPLNGLIDIKDETHPRLRSIFPTPEPPKSAPYRDFCEKGGRFGPHNTNLEYHLPDVEKQAELIYATFFNAGLRIFDVKDATLPKEVAWFVPPTPVKRYGPLPYDKLVSETEDVLVDTRGNIFITDKHWGIFVLKYLGKGEPAPTAK